MQLLFNALVFIVPGILAFGIWREIKIGWSLENREGRGLLLFSAITLSGNILLLYCCTVADLLVTHGHLAPVVGLNEYNFLLMVLWSSRVAVVMSLITLVSSLFSQHGLARKLCIWGSVAGLLWWSVLSVTASDLTDAYMRHHQ